MMKYLLVSLLFAAPVNPKTEAANQERFRAWQALCAKSKCAVCGTYSYEGGDGMIYYQPSQCETLYQIRNSEQNRRDQDAAIREKYVKPTP
jgi:hypothetical protein